MEGKVVPKLTVENNLHEKYFKGTKHKKGLKDVLRNLENEEICSEDVEGFKEELFLKPHLGDHIQFELHKFCMKDVNNKGSSDLVIKLAELCYSPFSVSHFKDISRFVGCVYHISSFLLKRGQYKPAVNVMNSLLLRKNEISKLAAEKQDVKTFLCNLHGNIMALSLSLASKVNSTNDVSYTICHNLAIESLNILNFIKSEQSDVGIKVLKTSLIFLHSVKYYTDEDILQYYESLKNILNVLMPKMSEIDYFLFFAHKMSQLKKPESDVDVYHALRKTVHLLTLFLRSSSKVVSVLYKIVDFFWCELDCDKWINEEEYKVLCKSDSQSVLYFILVSVIVSYGLKFVWRKYEKSWCDNVTVELIVKMSNTILDFHKSFWRIQLLYCHSVKRPFEICFLDLLTGNLHRIQYTIRLCLKSKIPNVLSLVPISQEAFLLSIECFTFMKMKEWCQEHISYSWKFSVIHHANTVEDIYRLSGSDESWNYLKNCCQEILKEVVNSQVELPFDYNRVKILFQRWHIACSKLKNYQQALYVCLVYYVFYPEEENDIMAMWLQTKSKSSNDITQEMTIQELLKTCDKSLKEFSRSYNKSNFCLKSALLMELKCYSTCPPDAFENPNLSYQLATKIWKHLEKYKLNFWELALAMSSMISASNAGDDEELPSGFLEKCQKHIDVLSKDRKHCRSLLHAANLIFSLFLYIVKTAERMEGKNDTTQMVLSYLKKTEEENVKLGEDVDTNLTCDVVPSSKHLTVELETNYLNELNRIVDLWDEALKTGHEDPPTPTELDLWLRNVKQVAQLYELVGEYRRAFTTWVLYYKIGKSYKNSGVVLLGLTHLIENCTDVDESGIKEEAEVISKTLGSEMTDRHVLVEYSLAVAGNYLKNKKGDKCLEYLSLAKKILLGLRTTITTYTLNAKFWCLVSQFLTAYREYEAVFEYPPGTDVRVMAFKAFSYANGGGRSDLIKTATQSECTELVLAMLEVNLWAYHLHGVYRQVDFMRFFLEDLYLIVRKLFLPTRTAEILVRLAEVDVICEKTTDCQEKVLKLKSILTTLSLSCKDIIKSEKPTSPYLSVPSNSDVDVSGLRPISPARFLESCPQTKELEVSPVQYFLKEAKSSKAKEHMMKCECRLCQNLLIQVLTFDAMWLEGEMYRSIRDPKQAAVCYSQSCQVLNKVERVRYEQSKTLQVESSSALEYDPGELDYKLSFVQFHCAKFLIKYALFEFSNLESVTENVGKTVQRIGKLMKKFSYEEKLLMWTFAELKLVLCKGIEKPPKSSSPVSCAFAGKTPMVSSSAWKTPAVTRRNRTVAKSPPGRKKIEFGEEQNQKESTVQLNTAFVESDGPDVQPQKVDYHKKENEGSTKVAKTVKTAAKTKTTTVQSRKLDFDISADLFEDSEPKPTPVKRLQTRSGKQVPVGTSTRGRELRKPVKIYSDSKETGKLKGTKKSLNCRKT